MFDFTETPRINPMDDSAIKKAIKSVVSHYNSKKGRENLHVLLVACCHHAVQHSDCSHLTDLFNKLPANANKEGIKTWLLEYSTFKWMSNKDGVKMFLGRDKENAKSYQFTLAGEAMPFYDMIKVKAAQDKPYSFLAGLENLLKVAESKVKNGKVGDPVEKMLIAMLSDSLPSAIVTAKAKVADAAKPEPKPVNNVVELAA